MKRGVLLLDSNRKELMDNTPAKISYGNPDINEIIESFTKYTGLKLTNIKRQRMFATHLIRSHGKEATIGMIQIIALTLEDKYAPRIADLEKLYYKWNDVEIYGRKKVATSRETTLVDLNTL